MAKSAAKGVIIAISDGVLPTFTPIGQVFSMGGPGLSADTVEVSAHDSAKFYREFVNSFRDGGELTLGLRWDPALATHSELGDGLLNLFERDVENAFEITWPNPTADVWQFTAFVTGYEPSADYDAALEASITLKLTGAPVFA